MTSEIGPNRRGVANFRTKLLAAMMLVVFAVTTLGLYLAQRNVAANAEPLRKYGARFLVRGGKSECV